MLTLPRIVAIYGSPRPEGNTSLLMKKAVEGARSAGAEVEEIRLKDLNLSPCREIYGCINGGRCAISDDFQAVYDQIDSADALMLASPIMFYTVSGFTKAMMDRCQSFWVRKYWLESAPDRPDRPGLFISVGATKGAKLFDGALLTVKYWLDAVGAKPWRSLLYRGLDGPGEINDRPEALAEAEQAGRELAELVG